MKLPSFSAPEECGSCHPRQYREWLGSMHSYAGQSPLFNALEVAGNLLTEAIEQGGPRWLAGVGVAVAGCPLY